MYSFKAIMGMRIVIFYIYMENYVLCVADISIL